MILTKENVAAPAFAEHSVSFGQQKWVGLSGTWSYKRTRLTKLLSMLPQRTDMKY